jgi:hypothetical protein
MAVNVLNKGLRILSRPRHRGFNVSVAATEVRLIVFNCDYLQYQ